MKRNGAGLASICILATMVLVMISSTSSLFFGSEEALSSRYARCMNVDIRVDELAECTEEKAAQLRDVVRRAEKALNIEESNVLEYRCAITSGLMKDGVLNPDADRLGDALSYENLCDVLFMPLDDYNRLNGTDVTLAEDEILATYRRRAYPEATFTVEKMGKTFRVLDGNAVFPENGMAAAAVYETLLVVLPDFENDLKAFDAQRTEAGNRMLSLRWLYAFDMPGLDEEEQITSCEEFFDAMQAAGLYDVQGKDGLRVSIESRAWNRGDFYSTYGGLFYLGVVLSIVFVFGAVLIIYYKQISEGYEDQARFDIMRKVGMTKKEIRRSINSQLLTVFFLPLALAGLHMAFAFPMIRRLLTLFNLNNIGLFAVVTLICYAVFALFYALVYRITSNAYYNIVSEARPE